MLGQETESYAKNEMVCHDAGAKFLLQTSLISCTERHYERDEEIPCSIFWHCFGFVVSIHDALLQRSQ